MGNIIKVSGADYTYNLNNDIRFDFDVRSNHISNLIYDGLTLKFTNSGPSGGYETAANSNLSAATITMPVTSPIGTNALVLGQLDDGNFAVLYIENNGDDSGAVRKFWKDGHIDPTLLYTMQTPKPNVPKGTPYYISKSSDRFTISYSNYNQSILFSSIPGLVKPAIGVLGSGDQENSYGFVAG